MWWFSNIIPFFLSSPLYLADWPTLAQLKNLYWSFRLAFYFKAGQRKQFPFPTLSLIRKQKLSYTLDPDPEHLFDYIVISYMKTGEKKCIYAFPNSILWADEEGFWNTDIFRKMYNQLKALWSYIIILVNLF